MSQFDEIVRAFVLQESGTFVTVTGDPLFLKTLRHAFTKHLDLPLSCIASYTSLNRAGQWLQTTVEQKLRPICIVERELEGVSTQPFLHHVLTTMPAVSVVLLTGEIERDRLVLLHELGVKNIITKPISINILVEKLASCIRPSTRLGELLDAGKELVARGQWAKALDMARQVLQLKPGSPAGLMLLGDVLKGLDRREEALAAYKEASKGAPLYLDPLKKLAAFFQEAGEPEKELKYLGRLDRLSPLNIDRKVAMGAISIRMGDTEGAKDHFDAAMELAKRQAANMLSATMRSIAESCLTADPELATAYLRQSLEVRGRHLDGSDVETYNRLGIALRRQGKWAEAAAEYAKARTLAPDDENLVYNEAMAYFEGKRYAKAGAIMAEALRMNPQMGAANAGLLANIGTVLYRSGQTMPAAKALAACLALDPTHTRARELLDRIGSQAE